VLPHCLARSDERGDRERLGLRDGEGAASRGAVAARRERGDRDGGSGHMLASSAAMLGSL